MEDTITYLSAPRFVWWDVTAVCNLACKHCYSSSGGRSSLELNTDEAKAILRQLAGLQTCFVYFLGGEPLMRPDFLELLGYCRELQLETMVNTNGWFLDPDTAQALKEARVREVRVSIDGSKADTHDWFRGVVGAHDRAVSAVKNLVDAGIPIAGVTMTLHHRNAHEVDALIRAMAALGASEFQCVPISPTGRARYHKDLELDLDQHKVVSAVLHGLRSEFRGKVNVFSVDGLMDKPCTECVVKKGTFPAMIGCGAGRQSCSIDPEGNVLPCLLMREPVAGNLRDTPFEEIWDKSDLFTRFRQVRDSDPACRSCEYKYVCARECPRSESQSIETSDSRQFRLSQLRAGEDNRSFRPCSTLVCSSKT